MLKYLLVTALTVFSPLVFSQACSPSPFTPPLGCAEFCYLGNTGSMPVGDMNGIKYDLNHACAGAIGPDCYAGSCSVPYNPGPVPPPLPPLDAAVAAALAVAFGLAAGVAAIAMAPPIVFAGAAAMGIAAGVAAAAGFYGGGSGGEPPPDAQTAADGAAPIRVRLDPLPTAAPAPAGAAGEPPAVGVNPDGRFVPTAGPAYTPESGGWRPVGTTPGDMQYVPPATVSNPSPAPTVGISGGGADVTQVVDSSNGGGPETQTVTMTKASGGEVVFTTTGVIPVTTPTGEQTTVVAYTTTTYASATGGPIATTSGTAATLGNGGSASGGITPSGGSGGSAGGAAGPTLCPVGFVLNTPDNKCYPDGTGTGDPGTGTGSCTGGDCATETTQVANRGLLQAIKDFFTGGSSTPPPHDGAPSGVDIGVAGVGLDDFGDLLGWRLPAHSAACPTSSFAWNGNTYTFNAHCSLIQDHFGAFRSVMTVLFTLSSLFIVLRA